LAHFSKGIVLMARGYFSFVCFGGFLV